MPEHTIAENLARLTAARTAIAGAITSKGGTVTAGDGLEDFPTDIATIPSGGSSVSENAVTFYDYDGTVVDSYTAAEFANLSSMPANPTHEGLTAQGWNWSLADAKAYVTKYGRLNIGQMYITSDGKTRIKIKLEEGRLEPVLGLGINGSVDVDWGDDTAHGTMTGSSTSTLVQLQHVYAAAGEYTIALTVTGNIRLDSNIFTKLGGTSSESYVYKNAIFEVNIGNGVGAIGSSMSYCFSLSAVSVAKDVSMESNYMFRGCYSLKYATISTGTSSIGQLVFAQSNVARVSFPNTITTMNTYTFQDDVSLRSITFPDGLTSIPNWAVMRCTSLTSVVVPDSVKTIGASAFLGCSALSSIAIPDSVETIDAGAFQECQTLTSITIPDNTASIGNSAFKNCRGLGFIKFEGSTPPTAGGSDTFNGIPTDCIIYVPTGSLEDYEDETNYPDPDVYTYVEY